MTKSCDNCEYYDKGCCTHKYTTIEICNLNWWKRKKKIKGETR